MTADATTPAEDRGAWAVRSVSTMRTYTLVTFAGMVVVAGVWPLLALLWVPPVWWRFAVLALGLAAVLAETWRLLSGALARFADGLDRPWRTGGSLLAGWLLPLVSEPELAFIWTLPVIGLVAAMSTRLLRRHRWLMLTGLGLVTMAVGVFGAARGDETSVMAAVLGTVIGLVSFVAADLGQIWMWTVANRLDGARRTAADLAVARERLRFAADLHDVQGHHLQVIALKGELVSRLIGIDDEAARAQAEELATIARTAQRETREVVQGYRSASLATEIGNAQRVLDAAGVRTEVTGDPDAVPGILQPLFGMLVREGTTNLLRHSQARCCAVSVTRAGGVIRVRMRNDRVGVGGPDGSGIAGLRERFAAVGGGIEAGVAADGWFDLVGSANEASASTGPVAIALSDPAALSDPSPEGAR